MTDAGLTAVVSDLHLGTRLRLDVLRDPKALDGLLGSLEGVERLVFLGDLLELRDRPVADVLEVARPVLEAVGEVMRGGQVIVVPGNHDHRIAREAFGLRPGLRRRRPLGLEELATPSAGIPRAIQQALGCETVIAYPGVRLHPDVWATHGHYVDAHSAARSLETLLAAAGATARRWPGPEGRTPSTPDDYEVVLTPTYGLFDAIAQAPALQRAADGGKRLVRAAEVRAGARRADDFEGEGPSDPARPLLARGDRLGTAPGERRRPGALPMARVLDRLGVRARTVLFGHTHRVGPLPGDPGWAWTTDSGIELHNTGSWVFDPAYARNPQDRLAYGPGAVTLLSKGQVQGVRRPLGHYVDGCSDQGRKPDADERCPPSTPLV